MRRGDVERAPIRPAPGQIADQFGNAQLADQPAVRRIDPDSARRRNPDIAERIAFHAVRHAGLRGRDDVGGEHPAVAEAAAGIDVEHADQMLDGIVDVKPLLVRRKAQPVRLIEQIAVDQQLRRAAAGRHAIDALEAELARPFDAVDRHPAVPRIGEIDRAVGFDADVVRRIQLQPVEMRRHDLAPPVGPFAHQRGGGVLADDQVQLGIIGHAVALVGRTHRLANALPVETAAHVARHVGEQKIMRLRVPDRAFRELEAGAGLPHRRPQVDQFGEGWPQRDMRGHRRSPKAPLTPRTSCVTAAIARSVPAPPCRAAPRPGRARSWRACHAPAAGSASPKAAA